jgi:hypothetical protein
LKHYHLLSSDSRLGLGIGHRRRIDVLAQAVLQRVHNLRTSLLDIVPGLFYAVPYADSSPDQASANDSNDKYWW